MQAEIQLLLQLRKCSCRSIFFVGKAISEHVFAILKNVFYNACLAGKWINFWCYFCRVSNGFYCRSFLVLEGWYKTRRLHIYFTLNFHFIQKKLDLYLNKISEAVKYFDEKFYQYKVSTKVEFSSELAFGNEFKLFPANILIFKFFFSYFLP